jgi:hypothetical protein
MRHLIDGGVGLGFLALLGLSLGACSASNPQNEACQAMAHDGSLPWGYYPGYGCGPVPPARTHFSGIAIVPLPVEGA